MKASSHSCYDYPETSDDGGGWLLSYVDLITLLATFFVLLLSMSSVHLNRFDLLRSTLSPDVEHQDLGALRAELDRYLDEEGMTGTVSTALDPEGLRVMFTNTVLFDSGAAEVRDDGKVVLAQVSALMSKIDPRHHLVVEGYTDDVPIHNSHFRSNWDLSAERAVRVLEELIRAGIAPERLSIQGFADTRPESPYEVEGADSSGDLHSWRSKNRRVVLRVY